MKIPFSLEITNKRGLNSFRCWAHSLYTLLTVSLIACFCGAAIGSAQTVTEGFSSGASNFTEIAGGTWSVSNGRYHLNSPDGTGAAQGLLANISVHQTPVSGDYSVSGLLRMVNTGSTFNDAAL